MEEKGIALTPGDWRLLKTHLAEIDLAMDSLEAGSSSREKKTVKKKSEETVDEDDKEDDVE